MREGQIDKDHAFSAVDCEGLESPVGETAAAVVLSSNPSSVSGLSKCVYVEVGVIPNHGDSVIMTVSRVFGVSGSPG